MARSGRKRSIKPRHPSGQVVREKLTPTPEGWRGFIEHERVLMDGHRHATTVALSHADLWVDFVEARNDYRVACENESHDSEAVAGILARMKEAYQRWSNF